MDMKLDIATAPPADGWEPVTTGNFLTLTGPFWRRQADDRYEYGLLAQSKHANHRNIVHGGVVMAFADYALGRAAADAVGHHNQVTVQLDVQFVSAAELGELLIGRGEVMRRTSSLFFLRGTVEVAGRVIASANGIWKAVKPLQPS